MRKLQINIGRARIFRWPMFAVICLIPALGGCTGAPTSLGSLIEQIIIGLILGSVYALIALGYTLVYGVIKLINFAHGDIYMLGAFVGYYTLRFAIRVLTFTTGLSLIWCFVIATVVSAVVCGLGAMLMERLAYRPMRRSVRIAALITAVGVSFLLENAGIIVFGANPRSYEPKTLEIYQLEVASDPGFSAARQIEVHDAAQIQLPDSPENTAAYARVRIVSREGTSPWSPVLRVDPAQPTGLVEQPAQQGGPAPSPIPSIGFSRQQTQGRNAIVYNWHQGAAEDISLPNVFSDKAGELYAFEIPIKTGTGQNVRIPLFNLLMVVVTLVLLWALNMLINRTVFGMSMRALSFDMDAAKLMGINTDRVISITFGIGGVCAAVAGNMMGIYNQSIDPLMGILPGIKAFVAAVVGGIGSIPGAAAGGLIMGLSESLVKGYINPAWSSLADALAFAILILVLLFKPSGLLGKAVREKV